MIFVSSVPWKEKMGARSEPDPTWGNQSFLCEFGSEAERKNGLPC